MRNRRQVEHRVVAAALDRDERAPAAPTAPIRQARISGLPQPSGLPRIRPKISRKRASEKVTRPGTSIGSGSLAKTLTILRSVRTIAADPDRDVDEEDPLPAEALGDDAADQRPDRDGAADRRAPDAERRRPVFAVELLADQGQRGGEHPGAADPLQAAGEVEQGRVLGDAAEERGEGEDPEADREDAPAPEPVAERAGGEQEGGEGQRVGVDDPLQAGEAGVEFALDVRQGDVDDGDVEQQHERRDRDEDEGPPFALHRRATLKNRPRSARGGLRPPGGRTSRGCAGRSSSPAAGPGGRPPSAKRTSSAAPAGRSVEVGAVDRDFDRLAAGGVADVEDVAGGDDQGPRGQRVRRDVADRVSLHAPGQDRALVGEVVAGRADRGGGDEAVAADVADLLAGEPVAELGDAVVRAAGRG